MCEVFLLKILRMIILMAYCCSADKYNSPPHIVFFFVDDMGINDVSYHGSPQIPTPNIDALAASSIILKNYYVLPQCTPSRASLMTGRYPVRLGLQHFVINAREPTALPLRFKIMPQYFKELNYRTHIVGKWHLGSHKKEFTPNSRGFDSFFGFWYGHIDYYDYTNYEESDIPGSTKGMWGVDLHDNYEPVRHIRGPYATEMFGQRAIDIISNHNTSEPLFLYVSNPACHVGNSYMPQQAPPECVARFPHITDVGRRTYAGVVAAMDDLLGRIFLALHRKRMLDNIIVVFSSDNGGEANGSNGGRASNWPLRGMKLDLWEGGVRVAGFIWSPLLDLTEPRTSTQLMHVSDWLPTLYSAAGGDVKVLNEIDGFDMWECLKSNSESPRNEILLNIDPIYGMFALREGDWKLISGTFPGSENVWYGPSGREDVTVKSMDEWVWKNGSVVKDILKQINRWLPKTLDQWRENTTIHCFNGYKPSYGFKCDPTKSPCLFNIKDDPCELENLAPVYPTLVESLMNRIQEYNRTAVPPLTKPVDPRADPRCHGFAYVSWMEDDCLTSCP